MIALLLACKSTPEPAEAALVPLAAPRLARRISLDLRGVLPSLSELESVEEDPAQLDGLITTWMADPLLEERLVDLLSERYLTRIEEHETRYFDYFLSADQEFEFERAVADEPLRLIARVITEDRPYSEIVTADWTMASPLLAQVWPLEREEGEQTWQVARYTDGRPAAGILSTNGLWWRYVSSPTNKNRRRAAMVLDLLLCEDILSRPISFSGAGSITTDVDTLIWENDACLSCHSTVDPLAASMFGFYWFIQYNKQEMTTYHPERELLGEDMLGVEMGWSGQPIGGLYALGETLREDPRFDWCAAQTVAELLWRREVDEVADFARVDALHDVYQESGGRLLPVIAEAVRSPTYQAGELGPGADEEADSREQLSRLLSPEQLHDTLEDLTGFRWMYDGFDQLANDTWGYRVLGGGVDGENVVLPQREPGLTWAVVTERMAQAATAYAFSDAAGTPPLLAGLDLAAAPDSDTLSALHFRLLATRPDADWLADAATLWEAVSAEHGPEAAWAAVAEVLLRDPDFVTY